MKKTMILLIVSFSLFAVANAQDNGQKHTGFYLSMGLGPAFGNINIDNNMDGKSKMSGTGATFDFKIGGAIKENLILHATLISNALVGPQVTAPNGMSAKATDKLSISEAMLGGGITYYIMPQNLFASISVGSGLFTLDNQEIDVKVSSHRGLSTQLKVGKEWWVSKRWGLGAAVTYGMTNVNSSLDNSQSEKMSSSRFGIVFNATLN